MDFTVTAADGETHLAFTNLDTLDYWARLTPPFVRSFTVRLDGQERDRLVLLLTHSDPEEEE